MTTTAVDERLLTPERLAELRAALENMLDQEWVPARVYPDVLQPLSAIALIDALTAERARVAELEEALRPFAALADDYIEYDLERGAPPMSGLTQIGTVMKFSDIHLARQTLGEKL